MLLLPFSSVIVVRQVEADVRVIWILLKWTLCHRAPVRRCVVDGQNGPPVKFLGAVTSFMSSVDRDLRHLRPVRVIQSIDRDLVFARAYQERLWNGPWRSCLLGSLPRILASTEVLCLGQDRKSSTQRTERGAILPVRAVGSKGNLAAASRRPRGTGVGFSHSPTSSCLRPHRCPARSAAQPRQPAI